MLIKSVLTYEPCRAVSFVISPFCSIAPTYLFKAGHLQHLFHDRGRQTKISRITLWQMPCLPVFHSWEAISNVLTKTSYRDYSQMLSVLIYKMHHGLIGALCSWTEPHQLTSVHPRAFHSSPLGLHLRWKHCCQSHFWTCQFVVH